VRLDENPSHSGWPSILVMAGVFAAWIVGATAHAQEPRSKSASAPTQTRIVPEGLNFANGLFRDRRYDMAADEYERFLADAKGADAIEARYGLANARLFQGKYAEARAQFEAFLKQAPEHPNAATARYRVGETSYMVGDLPASRAALEAYTAGSPGHRHLDMAWTYLGDVDSRMGDYAEAHKAYMHALDDFPENRLADRARFGLARSLAALKRTDEALEVLASLAKKGGADWSDKARFESGKLLAAAGRQPEAIEALAALEAASPKSALLAESRLRRAEALSKLKKPAEAEALLAPIAADPAQPLSGQAAYALGTAQVEQGKAAEALATFDAALKTPAGATIKTALLYGSAEAALKLDKLPEARARMLKAYEADPADPWADDALARAATLALEARDQAEAIRLAELFAKSFTQSPLRHDLVLVEARARLAGQDPKRAIVLLEKVLDEAPPGGAEGDAARYYLGLAYRADGQAARADEVFASLAKTPAAPASIDAQYLLGQGHMEAGRFDKAVEPLKLYLAGRPDGDVADFALAHLAHAYLELGDGTAAKANLETLSTRFPASTLLPTTRLRLAEWSLARKELEPAIEQFRLVAKGSDPKLAARANSGLGNALMQSGKPAEAADAFGEALAAKPEEPLAGEIALARARALESAGKVDEAVVAYEKAAAGVPAGDAGSATLAKARLLAESRRPAEAAEAYAAWLAAHPKGVDGVSTDDVLADWAWALGDAGKAAESDAAFGRLLEHASDGPRSADARVNLAETAFKARDYARVKELLAPVVAESAKVPEGLLQTALYRQGRTLAAEKDWPAAAKALDRLIETKGETPYRREARFWRAEVAFQAGDNAAAEARFGELAAEPPSPVDPPGLVEGAGCRRVQALVLLGRWKDALAAADAWKLAHSADPRTPEVDYARGRSLLGLARFDESREAFQAVIKAREKSELAARAQLMQGETYFHQKDYNNALREFLKVHYLYNAPDWQASGLLEAGKVYEELARWADAAETYERLRSEFPGSPVAGEAGTRLESARRRSAGRPGPADSRSR
jgi:tetratricopeptide (TPR) repeat protein